jgi:hypothetical protein
LPSSNDSLSPNTPPTSFDGDSQYSSHESDFSPMPSSVSSSQSLNPPPSPPSTPETSQKKRSYKKAFKRESMMDTSRLMLCMVVMSVLFFNPFNLIVKSNLYESPNEPQYQSSKGLSGRVLNSFNSIEDSMYGNNSVNLNQRHQTSSFEFMISWMMNLILVFICLFIIYINGEPYIDVTLNNDETLWLNYQMARKQFERKNYEESASFCQSGLRELGHRVPRTHFQLVVGIIWQLIRLLLDKIYIGRVFSKLGIWLNNLKSLKMYKLSALFYYEMHKFAYLNMKSEKEFILKTTTTSVFTTNSYLNAVYFLLAAFNMTEIYTSDKKNEMNHRDEFNLCEIYYSIILFTKLYLPQRVSKIFVNHLIQDKLVRKLDFNDKLKSENACKLSNLKALLKNNLFIQYIVDLETFSDKNDSAAKPQKTLNLISYKQKLFNSSFLYDSDDSVHNFDPNENNFINNLEKLTDANGVACDFVLSKFQDFILNKMTNHIINQSGMVTTDRILNATNNRNIDSISLITRSDNDLISQDEEQKELADVDQIKFERLIHLYENNLQYFSGSKFKKTNISNEVVRKTQEILIKFLSMLNNWKLRKFDFEINTQNLINTNKRLVEAFLLINIFS